MSDPSTKFIILAMSNKVMFSALKVSLIVGTLLAFINYGSSLIALNLTGEKVFKILLTYFVPYCVSTYSSVKAIQDHHKQY